MPPTMKTCKAPWRRWRRATTTIMTGLAVLWACYSDEEPHAIHERIIAAIPLQEMQATMRWHAVAVATGHADRDAPRMNAICPGSIFAALMTTF